MVKEGYPFVLPPFFLAVAATAASALTGSQAAGGGALLLFSIAAFMAYFFRDPLRVIPQSDDIVISAADGKVTRIEENEDGKLVSVFLSPLDVHINRSPIDGKVVRAEYIKGKKLPATSDESSLVNERNRITIEGNLMTVSCIQIAGIVARRIVCWSDVGDHLSRGQKYGLIKFSSRTDLELPKNVDILVSVGDRVVGGETIIARLKK